MASKRRGANGVALAFPLVALLACSTSPSSSVADSGVADSSVPEVDTGVPNVDAGTVPADASITCAPASVQGYVPRWTPPKAPESACTQAELASFGACLDSSGPTSAACLAWNGADASTSSACKSCVADSKATDPAWGPLVDVGTNGSDRQLNVSGCLAIVLHDTGSGCAGSYQALQECESAACADNCQGASTADLRTCIQEADAVGCSTYLAPAACVYDAGTTGQECFGVGQPTFGQKFAAMAAVFCLAGDGGADGG
jgi:hypothetical protein